MTMNNIKAQSPKMSYSLDDGQTWQELPLIGNYAFTFDERDAELVTIEPITFTLHTTYVSFYYVKTALACMHYWLGEMCGSDVNSN